MLFAPLPRVRRANLNDHTGGTRRHRVIQYAVVNGQRDHLNLSLTDGKTRIFSARKYANTFHTYEFTARDGQRLHVAYAHYEPGSPKHGFARFGPDLDVTYLFETTANAVEASFGLAPRTN
jgi:hypothetical protein